MARGGILGVKYDFIKMNGSFVTKLRVLAMTAMSWSRP